MRRRLVAAGAIAAGAAAALAGRRRRPVDHVALFFDDGTVVSLSGDDAKPLLDIAHRVL